MSLSDSNLTDIGEGTGKTTNFWVRYENTLADQNNVINNANSLLAPVPSTTVAVIENEFTVTTGWFNTPAGKFGTGQRQGQASNRLHSTRASTRPHTTDADETSRIADFAYQRANVIP